MTTSKSSATKAHWSSWIGPSASFLCLIHCIGLGLLAILAPGLARFLPHSPWIDISVTAVVVTSGALSLRRLRAPRAYWRLLWAMSSVSVAALVFDLHTLAHFATLITACIQIPLLTRHFRNHSHKHSDCCEHDHQH